MITVLLKEIFLTSIWILAIKIATSREMIFENFGNWCEDKVEIEKKKVFDTFCYCPYCMPSLHSIVGFGFGYLLNVWNDFDWRLIVLYILCVFGSSVVSGFLWALHDLILNVKKHYKNLNDYNEEAFEQNQEG